MAWQRTAEYDAVIVGASLAGCSAAILLGRTGAKVALVEKQPDPSAFKRICSHYIQASALPTLERLGLLEPMRAAGAVRSRARVWTPFGLVEAPPERSLRGVNLRRERLDPLVRKAAADTQGVDLLPGRTAVRLISAEGSVRGVAARDREGRESLLSGRLTIGADGRDSRIAALAGLRTKIRPHGRFAYGAYFEGVPRSEDPVSTLWLLDPQVGAEFPTDSDLVFYVAMLTKDRLPAFKDDPGTALVSHVAALPGAPPISEARRIGPVIGKVEMPSHVRTTTAPGLALIGDAALAADPLFGIGCGWAFQSGEWLADSVAPALGGSEPLRRGLARYRRRHRRELWGHAFLIDDYATGRPIQLGERMVMSAASQDERLALTFEAFGARSIKPMRMLAETLPRTIALQARRAIASRDRA